MTLGSYRTRLLLFPLLLMLPAGKGLAQSAHERDDFQIWNEFQLEIPLRHHMDLRLIGALREGRNGSHFVNERYGAALQFQLGKYATLSPTVYSVYTQPLAYHRDHEIRFILEGTVRVPFLGFTFSDRQRFERRFFEGPDSSRYRNKLQIEHPIRLEGMEVKTFVSDEIQYDGAKKAWSRNRFAIGGGKEIGPRTTLEIYYLRQTDGYFHPGNIHAIGTTLRFSLRNH